MILIRKVHDISISIVVVVVRGDLRIIAEPISNFQCKLTF